MSESTREIVIDVLRCALGPEADLGNSKLELESLKMIEVVVALENELPAPFPKTSR